MPFEHKDNAGSILTIEAFEYKDNGGAIVPIKSLDWKDNAGIEKRVYTAKTMVFDNGDKFGNTFSNQNVYQDWYGSSNVNAVPMTNYCDGVAGEVNGMACHTAYNIANLTKLVVDWEVVSTTYPTLGKGRVLLSTTAPGTQNYNTGNLNVWQYVELGNASRRETTINFTGTGNYYIWFTTNYRATVKVWKIYLS